MKKIRTVTLTPLAGVMLLAGCANTGVSTDHQAVYQKPTKANFENSIIINEPSELVWDRLVEKLSTSFFSINNIEKASRLINVSVSSKSPNNYVDCGTSKRTDSFAGQTKNYTYPTASSSKYTYSAKHPQNALFTVHADVSRDVGLDGRVNIYLAPEGQDTKVTVNAIYELDLTYSYNEQVYNAFGGLIAQQPSSKNLPGWANFTTSTPDTETFSSENIACVSRGVLEQQILDMAKQ